MIKWINKKRNKKGFTLIELIVVIAILGILAAIAIPRLTSSRLNAERSAIEANLRTIDGAISMWEASNTVPAAGIADTDLTNATTGTLRAWPEGPEGAIYIIDENRAKVHGEVAGETIAEADAVLLEELSWR